MVHYLEYGLSYLVIAYILLGIEQTDKKFSALACLNVAASYLFFFHGKPSGIGNFFAYLFLVSILYLIALLWKKYNCSKPSYLLAIIAPVLWLIGVKLSLFPAWIGISYMAFRLSYLIYEIETKRIAFPSLAQYFGFGFFPPTLMIGPISPYNFYITSISNPDREITPLDRSLARILVGIIKAGYFAQLAKTLTFSVLWNDGFLHGPVDFVVSCIASYLYLYLNFAGGTDVVIGISGILNIKVTENFNLPILSRNLSIFWQRFHISLYQYLHDLVYSPLSLSLTRKIGDYSKTLPVVISLLTTFILVGLWHGITLSFLILGSLHAIGMIICFYYGRFKRKISASQRNFLDHNPVVNCFFILLTFLYVSFTMLFFENSFERVLEIFSILRF